MESGLRGRFFVAQLTIVPERDTQNDGINLENTNETSSRRSSSLPLVIVNPRSASGSTRENWSMTASELRAHFGPFNVAFTKAPGHAIELADRAARNGRSF